MKTLQSFLQEFAIFKSPENNDSQDTNDMEFDVPSQDTDPDVENLPTDQDDDQQDQNCQCQCTCPCCQKSKENGISDDEIKDSNIEVIEPKEGGFDVDDETGMADDEDEDSDPTKEFDLF